MDATLTIYFPHYQADLTSSLVFWCHHQGSQPLEFGSGKSNELLPQLHKLNAKTIRLILPGELITTADIDRPSKSLKTSTQAAPYLLEEELSESPDQLFFVPETQTNDTHKLSFSILDKAVLGGYINLLESAGLEPDEVFADRLLLIKNESLHIGKKVLLASSTGKTSVVSRMSLEHPFPSLKTAGDYERWLTECHTLLATDSDEVSKELAEFISRPRQGANLRAQEFRRQQPAAYRQLWRSSATSLAACLVLALGYLLGMGWQLHSRADELYQQAETRYRELFPDDQRILNIRTQMQGRLGQNASNTGDMAITMIGEVADELMQSAYQIQQLRYQSENNSLQIQLQARNLESLNELQSQLAQSPGFSAELLSANANDAGTIASLRISPVAGAPR